MLEQLKQINNMYDLLALCASYVLNEYSSPTNIYEFATFNEDKFKCIYNAVEHYTYDCEDRGYRDAFNELKKDIMAFLEEDLTLERVYAIIYCIDELVEVEINDNFLGNRHIVKYSALNDQYQDCVRIIPKKLNTFLNRGDIQFKSVTGSEHSLFREKRKCACNDLDREMENYSIWDKKVIRRYPFTICRFDKKSHMTKYFRDRGKFSIGIVPFTDRQLTEILDIRYNKRAFTIYNMYSEMEKELKYRYEDICRRSKQNNIDFLVFPEMLLTDNIIFDSQDHERTNPQIIVNGSISKNRVNKTIVTDGDRRGILTYCKKEPFTIEKDGVEYKEWLDPTKNKEYSVIEIEGMGRIGVAICKDLLSEDVKMFHKYIGTDILIAPAYTRSSDLLSAGQHMSMDYNCVVVIANACSALEDGNLDKEVGFVTLPMKNKNRRCSKVIPYFRNKCAKECSQQCVGKKIEIDFYNTEQDAEGISYQVRETPF